MDEVYNSELFARHFSEDIYVTPTALEEVIEPFLLQQGLIQRTPRGRMLAQKAWTHLGLDAPKREADLFG
jgi:Holliday junction resolvasome RuvABC ATP-dependent DNA helicase subunit